MSLLSVVFLSHLRCAFSALTLLMPENLNCYAKPSRKPSVYFGMIIILKANDNDLFTTLGTEGVKTTVEVKRNPCEARCVLGARF